MRQEPSYTAATMALQHAFESDRPSGSRLFCDPYAEAFTSGPLRFLARASRLPLVGPLAPKVVRSDRRAGATPVRRGPHSA